jgi:Rod binding domain-containing protein
MLDSLEITGLQRAPAAGTGREKLEQSCREFESIFLTYMLKSMRSALVEEGILGSSHESKIMNSMLDEKLAENISLAGGIGLGRILCDRLSVQWDDGRGADSPEEKTDSTAPLKGVQSFYSGIGKTFR